jgi:heme A synthase
MKSKHFAIYTWALLLYNIIVILWGALVRATGSGAGCGSHWPLCQGEVVPLAPQVPTVIEFTHRMMSALSVAAITLLIVWGFRVYGKGHPVRKGVIACGLLIIAEALAGATLVLFGWVADNVSLQRAVSMPLHLVITFALLAALALTAWFASGGGPVRVRGQGWLVWAWIIALAGTLILGMSGAVTALGDTLFPVKSLAEGLAQDVSPTAHFLVRLRMWHPFVAVAMALYAVVLAQILRRQRPGAWVARLAQTQIVLFVVQCVAGAFNVALLAPVWMQIVHLLLADLVWINLVLLGAAAFAVSASQPGVAASE